MKERKSPSKDSIRIYSIQRRSSEQVEKSSNLLSPKLEKDSESISETTNGSEKASGKFKLKRQNTGPSMELKEEKKLNLLKSDEGSEMKSEISDKFEIEHRI